MTPRRFLLVSVLTAALAGMAGCGNGLQVSSPPVATPALTQATDSPTPSVSTAPAGPASGTPAPPKPSRDTPTTRATTAPPTTPPTCRLSDLDIGVGPADGGGAAGSAYLLLTFRNRSDDLCTLYGYPGVSFVGKGNGTQIGAAAARAEGQDPKTVSLEPGDRTTALLRVVQAGNYGNSCRQTPADGFRVYPPESKTAAFVRYEGTGCADDKVTLLEISPIGTRG